MARTRDPGLEAQRRASMADAAIDLLAEGSWRSVTLEDVARRAGMSKGAVTYRYASKEALFLDALARFHERYQARLLEVAGRSVGARRKLAALLEVALPGRQEVVREVRFQAEVWALAKEHPAIEKAIAEQYGAFRLACEALLQVGVEEGYVTVRATAGLYRYLHALLDGLTLQVAFDPAADVPAIRRRLLSLVEQWLRAPASSPAPGAARLRRP